VLICIAIFADFIANERPIICKLDGQIHFPVLKQYAVNLGITAWDEKFVVKCWDEHNYDWAWFALIPYSATTLDKKNRDFVSPFGKQDLKSWRWRHWIGTDELGRDVAAGMIAGTRIAMMVGIVAMSIATLIGVILGAMAGYFGDTRFAVSRVRIILTLLGIFIGFFYGFIARGNAFTDGFFSAILSGFFIFIACIALANLIVVPLKKIPVLAKKIPIAIDILVMRLIEVLNAIPGLLLILSIVALTKPSIFNVMIIIGLISWTSIARFMRAELLRVRSLEYIEAAQAMGFPELRIILRHAIPNALTPVLITIAFGIASAILTEAFLSFLGIGVAAEEVTWGSLLNLARANFKAWWLALFPGLAIFFTVTIFNLIGEGLTDALDPRLKQ
jgi:peptide/nickel transport system permease protein